MNLTTHAQPHYQFDEGSYTRRLVFGWTGLIAAIPLLIGWFPVGLAVFFISVPVLASTYYADHKNRKNQPAPPHHPPKTPYPPSIRSSLAYEYRDLHDEGILTESEYQAAITRLYPESVSPTH